MAKNKLEDLNDHLFAQLERLNDEDMSEEKMKLELQKAKSMSGVATQVINNAKLRFEAVKYVNEERVPGAENRVKFLTGEK